MTVPTAHSTASLSGPSAAQCCRRYCYCAPINRCTDASVVCHRAPPSPSILRSHQPNTTCHAESALSTTLDGTARCGTPSRQEACRPIKMLRAAAPKTGQQQQPCMRLCHHYRCHHGNTAPHTPPLPFKGHTLHLVHLNVPPCLA
jgi:hypothetical protein